MIVLCWLDYVVQFIQLCIIVNNLCVRGFCIFRFILRAKAKKKETFPVKTVAAPVIFSALQFASQPLDGVKSKYSNSHRV